MVQEFFINVTDIKQQKYFVFSYENPLYFLLMLYSTNFYALSEYILNEKNLFMAFCYDILHVTPNFKLPWLFFLDFDLSCPGFEKKKFQELIKDFIQN